MCFGFVFFKRKLLLGVTKLLQHSYWDSFLELEFLSSSLVQSAPRMADLSFILQLVSSNPRVFQGL